MATPRKRNSGFLSEVTEKPQEEVVIVTPIEPVSEGVICDPEEVTEERPIEDTPLVFESIVPAEDFGPRFIEKETSEEAEKVLSEVKSAPPLAHPPKRSPRNIPKFSRHK
jgi:hypothetical protein